MNDKYKDVIDTLDELSYEVTQNNATEPPFNNKYDDHFEDGIYVDKISRKVLFTSLDKYNSGCGWPAFTKPADTNEISEKIDKSHNMVRTEVRTTDSDSHLGHVFNDGPTDKGGLRYCINSAALDFIPVDELESQGYTQYLNLFKKG